MKAILRYSALALILLVLPTLFVLAQSGGVYDLSRHTIDGGGGYATGGNFTITASVGQPDAAVMTGGNFTLRGGFWHSADTHYIYLPLVLK